MASKQKQANTLNEMSESNTTTQPDSERPKSKKKGRIVLVVLLSALVLIIASLILVIVLKNMHEFKTDESAIRVNEDGTLEEASIDNFNEDLYDTDGLNSYVTEEVATYTDKYGEDSVTIVKSEVIDGEANVYLDFNSATDYKRFYNTDMYVGTLDGARAEGIELPSDVPSDGSLGVVITAQHVGLQVPGEIQYVSKNVTKVDNQTTTMKADSDIGEVVIVVYLNNK